MGSRSFSSSSFGASKRARYWLGDKAVLAHGFADDDVTLVLEHPGDDEVDAENMMGSSDFSSNDFTESDNDDIDALYQGKGVVRGMSEDIMESMEV